MNTPEENLQDSLSWLDKEQISQLIFWALNDKKKFDVYMEWVNKGMIGKAAFKEAKKIK